MKLKLPQLSNFSEYTDIEKLGMRDFECIHEKRNVIFSLSNWLNNFRKKICFKTL